MTIGDTVMPPQPGTGRLPVPQAQENCQAGIPNAARIYDWLLGGKDNYDADRQAARRLLRAVPGARKAAVANRAFLGRAVHYLAEQGITQFIDIGSGLPAAGPVHEVARQVRPDARVCYVDHDPVVIAHARALLADGEGLSAALADLRHPAALLADADVLDVIDPGRPAGVLLVAILHFIADADEPHALVRQITSRLAPGSWLVISHVTADHLRPGAAVAARAAYAGASVPAAPRTRAQVAAFLDGLETAGPGVTDVRDWRQPDARPRPPVLFWAGAARIPG
jgi:SAM-dependent methyltransferase